MVYNTLGVTTYINFNFLNTLGDASPSFGVFVFGGMMIEDYGYENDDEMMDDYIGWTMDRIEEEEEYEMREKNIFENF